MNTTRKYVSNRHERDFDDQKREGSIRSAIAVLPVLLDLYRPESIVDFGCGVGTWLAAAKYHGIEQCLGLEGGWVKDRALQDRSLEIRETDLDQTISLDRRFDLAMSLDVAGYLKPERAATFVGDLCRASDVVLFSAPAPGDSGDEDRNEQWAAFWASHFVREGYIPLDFIRPKIEDNEKVEACYRNNIVLYAKPDRVGSFLPNVSADHLDYLDFRKKIDVIGFEEAKRNLLLSTRHFAHWTKKRALETMSRHK